MTTWLLLDCNYLCYRAYHALGNLSFHEIPTGVIFGFLRDVTVLMDWHATDNVAFCFDCGKSKRHSMLQGYKSSRRKRFKADKQEKFAHNEVRNQIYALRNEYLPAIGFRNIFWQPQYEADDIIASLVEYSLGKKDEAIIVSSDADLYQLLSSRVRMWNPHKKKMTTLQSFYEEWGIYPSQWPRVKAIAGCSTDDIPGVKGVGEKTAAKFVAGLLKPGSAAVNKITSQKPACYRRNIELVTLPFIGCNQGFKFRPDEVTQEKWEKVADTLGLKSLRNEPPIPSRMRRKRRASKT